MDIHRNRNTRLDLVHRGGGAVRVYISVIQKLSFLSPPTTHSGSVRCQLRPDPTAADPTVTGWKDSGM